MVANLGDRLIIENVGKYFKETRKVQWSQDLGVIKSVYFTFFPFYRVENKKDVGFVAVEIAKIGEFQKLCKEVKEEEESWSNTGVGKYEFTVTRQFKYGQNEGQTFRFLVLQNPSYNPFQHRFTEVADSTEAGTILGNIALQFSDLDTVRSVVGDELRSY